MVCAAWLVYVVGASLIIKSNWRSGVLSLIRGVLRCDVERWLVHGWCILVFHSLRSIWSNAVAWPMVRLWQDYDIQYVDEVHIGDYRCPIPYICVCRSLTVVELTQCSWAAYMGVVYTTLLHLPSAIRQLSNCAA